MSPGSVTERLHFFVAEYAAGDRIGAGGGVADEGEDIEVLELGYDQAIAMLASGEIADGKTIMLLQYLQLRLMRPRGLIGDPAHEAMFHPHAERLLARCDAVLRIGGASAGADAMVAAGERLGLKIFRSLGEIPVFAA